MRESAAKSVDAKFADVKDVEADPDSLANAPRVHLTGKRYLPVVEMLRNYWLPGESLFATALKCVHPRIKGGRIQSVSTSTRAC